MDKETLIRLSIAIALGAIVGAEREYRSKSAGFRTMILISLGACLFTMMSIAIGMPGNPDRIASNIATGIGFLGAGVIFRSDYSISGITTAATIWAVAAIGVAVGSGHIPLAVTASLMIVSVLALLPYAQRWIDIINHTRLYTITYATESEMDLRIAEQLKTLSLKCKPINTKRDGNIVKAVLSIHGRRSKLDTFTALMLKDARVLNFEG